MSKDYINTLYQKGGYMNRILLLMVLILIPCLLSAAEDQNDRKPLVTVKSKDGSTLEFKFDTITDREVIGLDRTSLKPIRLPRNKVLSINFQSDQTPKLGAGAEGVVLTDGSVVRGRIVAIDEDTITLRPAGNAKDQVVERSKVAIIELATTPTAGNTKPAGTAKQVAVPATVPWVDTGIDVKVGDRIWITAPSGGFISCGPQTPNVNPDGAHPFVQDPSRPIPDVKACALIGRIGNQVFRIGLIQTPIVAEQSGRLSLGINDHQFNDNSGQWVVSVKVERSDRAAAEPAAPSGVNRTVVSVPATEPWTITQIEVQPGQRLYFTVPSDAVIDCGTPVGSVTADGFNPYSLDPKRPLPELKACTLIGKVGNGKPFKIGLNQTPVPVSESGKLALGINDYSFQDNSGDFGVAVVVE